MAATGNEYVKLSQLKMLSDNLESDILGQFSDELDTIIGGDTTPVTDITARLAVVNGTTGNVDAQLDTLDGTKSAIKDAIIAKGVEVPEGTVFRDYAAKIGEIKSGGVDDVVNVTVNWNKEWHNTLTLYYLDPSDETNKKFVSSSNPATGTTIKIPQGSDVIAAFSSSQNGTISISDNDENKSGFFMIDTSTKIYVINCIKDCTIDINFA